MINDNENEDEIYISTDIEAAGPSPGPNYLMSIGAAAFNLEKDLLGVFEANLKPIPNSIMDPKTKSEFWDKQPEAYARTLINQQNADEAMHNFKNWIGKIRSENGNKRVVFVGYPAVYDFKWIDWYFNWAKIDNPFGFGNAICIKNYAFSHLKSRNHSNCVKRNYPKQWFKPKIMHTHVAYEDAIGQGILFVNVMRENLGLEFKPKVKNLEEFLKLMA